MAVRPAAVKALQEALQEIAGDRYGFTAIPPRGDDSLLFRLHRKPFHDDDRVAYVRVTGHAISELRGHQHRESFLQIIRPQVREAIREVDGDSEFYTYANAWISDVQEAVFQTKWGDVLYLLLDGLVSLESHMELRGLLRPEMKLPEQVREAARELGLLRPPMVVSDLASRTRSRMHYEYTDADGVIRRW
jgi:hypothetical protein